MSPIAEPPDARRQTEPEPRHGATEPTRPDGAPGPAPPDHRIRDLTRRNPGQASFREYRYLYQTIGAAAPCELLVFGVGRDSSLWIEANRDGVTVFLEHHRSWIERARREIPDLTIQRVEYTTRRWQWWWQLWRPERLFLNLPADLLETDWDVIFVDAPGGDRWKRPGRMQSIYTAAALAKNAAGTCDVLVHDCDRRVERVYTDRFLGEAFNLGQVETLRHYRL